MLTLFLCLPLTTPTEAGSMALLLGLVLILFNLCASFRLFKIEGEKATGWFILGFLSLIGGGLIVLGAWWLGWWGN
jgi:hypothetical protein